MDTISVTRALKEIKLLGSRIEKATTDLNVVDIKQQKFGEKALVHNMTVDEFNKKAKSKYDSLKDLMNRRQMIKSAIIKSNAVVTIKIGKRQLTVADAIEERRSIGFKKALLNDLKTQKNDLDERIEVSREKIETQLEKLIETNVGKDKKSDKEDYDRIAKPFLEANEIILVDPIKIGDEIETLETEIETFEADVDIVLSESNSKTELTLQ